MYIKGIRREKTRYFFLQIITLLILLYMVTNLFWWYSQLSEKNHQLHLYALLHPESITPKWDMSQQQLNEYHHEIFLKHTIEGAISILFTLAACIGISFLLYKQFKSIRNQNDFLRLLTHELKTPITVGKINMQNALKYHLDKKKSITKDINNTILELNNIDHIINKILNLVRLEGNYEKLYDLEKVNVIASIEHSCKRLKAIYPSMIRIDKDLFKKSYFIYGDASLLELMFSNLIENACKHSFSDRPIEIEVSEKDGAFLSIAICDEGVGIPKKYQKKIFKKHFTVSKDKSAGSGLGLHLCQLISNLHKTKIEYKRIGRTNKFIISFPLIY